jgi:hypothetical protein
VVDVKDIKEPVAALQKILAEEGATSEVLFHMRFWLKRIKLSRRNLSFPWSN